MIPYLLKSIACLLILLLVHRLLLQREAMHRFNRFFLIFSVAASFLIPAYTIEVSETLEEGEHVDVPAQLVAEENYYEPITETQIDEAVTVATIEEVQTQFNWEYLLVGIYGLISIIFLYRFIRNIKILVNKIQRNIKINYRGQTLVLLKEESLPFSFLKYIFVAESDLEDGKFTDAVFAHECTHVQEKHSWDNLLIELLLVPFWFHPGLYWAKASIKLNHEFIADEIALRSTSLEKYESQLLAMMLSEQKYGLASSLNFSLTKKRFEMMKRKSVSGKSWIKLVVLVPILGALVYFFSERVAAKQEGEIESEVYVNNSNQSYLEEMDFDLTFTLKPDGVIQFKNQNYDLDEVKELISEAKNSTDAVNINLVTEPGLSMGDLSDFQAVLRDLDIRRVHYVNTSRKISKAQEDQKAKLYSEVRFLVYADKMHYENKNYSQLTDKERSMLLSPPAAPLEMTNTDTGTPSIEDDRQNEVSTIPHNSFAPDVDPYLTYNLFTESYVEEVTRLKNAKGTITITPAAIWLVDLLKYADPINYFSQKLTEYDNLRNGKPHYINKSAKEQAIIDALFYELTAIFFQFDKGMRSELSSLLGFPYYPVHPPYYPYIKLVKNGEIFYKEHNELNDDERKLVPPPPPPLPARKTTDATKNPADYKRTNPVADQKNVTASKWPPAVKAARIQHDLQSYIDAQSTYEKLRNQAPHFVKRNKAEQDHLTEMFSDLGSMYYQIAFYDKAKVDRPVRPFAPYMKLESNGQVYYKMGRDLTAEELSKLPPPPPPPTPVEQVEAYKKVYYKYELTRNKGRNDAHLSMAEREAMFLMYNELQEKFLYMDAPERRQVKMVNFPYYRVEEDGKVVFKAVSELTPEQRALNNC